MRPARSFLAARENSVAENVAKARLRIITCPFSISSTLWRNRLLRPAASLCWSIWPFELSELCRRGLQPPVTIKWNFLSSCKWKNCSRDIGSFDSFRSKLFAKVISCFKSFLINEYDLRILSRVFLIEMFDLRGNELKYAKDLPLNHCRKSVQNPMRLQDMCG